MHMSTVHRHIHCHGLYYALGYVFSLRVFKQMDAHTRACVCYLYTHARPHSFILFNTRGKTMFSHNQILINPKSYGHVNDVCVKKICVCCTVFADALI